jgi:hypothetical protein
MTTPRRLRKTLKNKKEVNFSALGEPTIVVLGRKLQPAPPATLSNRTLQRVNYLSAPTLFGSQTEDVELFAVSTSRLRDNLTEFLSNLGVVVGGAPERFGRFELDQVEISAEVTAEGDIHLLGIGGKAGVQGGVKFVMKRPSAPASEQ